MNKSVHQLQADVKNGLNGPVPVMEIVAMPQDIPGECTCTWAPADPAIYNEYGYNPFHIKFLHMLCTKHGSLERLYA